MNALLVLLTIIKYIFIALIVLIGVVITLIAIILLVPIRYDVDGAYDKQYAVKLRAFWFLRIVKVFYTAGNQPGMDGSGLEIKVFWKYLAGGKKDKGQSGQEEDMETPPDLKDESDPAEENPPEKENGPEDKTSASEEVEANNGDNEEESTKKGIKEKITGIFDKVIDLFEKAQQIINYPDKDEIIRLSLLLLKRLGRALRPKVVTLEGELGFDDPSVTGQALGGIYATAGFFGILPYVRVKGNFDGKSAVIKGYVKGRFNLLSLLWPLAAYALAKPVWKIVKPMLFDKSKKQTV